jgi:hypothetical protein
MDGDTLRHEKIHIQQQRELWVIGFYILYAYYWMANKIKGMNSSDAYHAIPFEAEAYAHETEDNYLLIRTKMNWRNYK